MILDWSLRRDLDSQFVNHCTFTNYSCIKSIRQYKKIWNPMKNAFNFDLKIRFHSTTTTNPRENLQNRTGTDRSDRPQKVENFQKTKAFKNFLTTTKHALQTSIRGLESSRKKQTRFFRSSKHGFLGLKKTLSYIQSSIYESAHPSTYIL